VLDVQVVLNGRNATAGDLAASAQSLLGSLGGLQLAHTDEETVRVLRERFGASVSAFEVLRPGVPLLVAPGGVVFAVGAVRRVVAQTEVPGRRVSRVFLPGLGPQEHLACWSASFLRSYQGSIAALVDADLAFDREHLSHSSPQARTWLPAHAVGVALTSEIGGDLARWSRRTGLALDARGVWTKSVRGPAGAVRRRLLRRRHRRQGAGVPRSLR